MAGGVAVRVAVVSLMLAACGTSSSGDGGAGDDGGGSPAGGSSNAGGTSGTGQTGGGGSGATNGGGSGGSAGSGAGGTNAGAAGSSAGSGAMSEVEACMAYASAFCRRNASCQGFPDTGPYACSSTCPDLMFAPGSTRTIAGLFECAETLSTWPCEDFLAGRMPPCTTPGTRQVGEPCFFASQCQTLSCENNTIDDCGMCARVVGENEDCSAPDVSCGASLFCDAGICHPYTSPDPKQPGESCPSASDCDDTVSFCNAQGICEVYPGENASCALRNRCSSTFYCASSDHICRQRPTLGQACGDDAATLWACADGLRCTTTSSSGTCVEPTSVGVGADCTSPASVCPANATCACVDSPACTMRRCTVLRLLGESCNDVDRCHEAFECVNGSCALRAYGNIFEDACGP